MLELNDLSLLVGRGEQAKSLLWEVDLKLPSSHHAAIIGPSGCGKSTLLKSIAGLLEPTTGSIRWKGRDLAEEEDLAPYEIGYVPQFSIAYDELTVWESVEYAMKLRVAGIDDAHIQERTEFILLDVGLDTIHDRRVKVLSGGQKRRLSLALEMVTSPQLLLCDEVTSGLDPKAEVDVLNVLKKVSRKSERVVLTVTHSLRHLPLFDSVLVLHEGHVAFHGPSEYLLHYFDVPSPEEIFPRLARKSAEGWHRSWHKHRDAYYDSPAMREEVAGAETKHAGSDDGYVGEASDMPKEEMSKAESEAQNAAVQLDGKPRPENGGKSPEPPEDSAANGKPENENAQTEQVPGVASQFLTLLSRRWKIFFRSGGQIWLHLALIIGFPCLVVVFALDGMPAIQNLDMDLDTSILDQLVDANRFIRQSMEVGSLVSGLVMFQVILLTLMGANNAAREIASERQIYEKERLGGVRPASYLLGKLAFLLVLVVIQSLWMAWFVKSVCRLPGDFATQCLLLFLVNAALTCVSLGLSSLMRTAEQASLVSIYLVGFQLPLSGAVLALPDVAAAFTQPFIASYWSWSGILLTMRDTRLYDVVRMVAQTEFSAISSCIWVLGCHVLAGIVLAYMGCKRSQWD